jgi:hypothetical protein
MLSTGLSTIVVNYSKAKSVFVWFFSSPCKCFLHDNFAPRRITRGRARLRQPDEDEPARLSGQRKIIPTILTTSQKLSTGVDKTSLQGTLSEYLSKLARKSVRAHRKSKKVSGPHGAQRF